MCTDIVIVVMRMDGKFIIHPKPKMTSQTSVISLRLSDLIIDKLEVIASKSGHSRNEVISMCIEYALNNLEIKEETIEEDK